MGNKIRKNGFVEGTMIAYFAIIISKLLGLVYVIPFNAIVGEEGMAIYSYAYTFYNIFLQIAISGIPTAISIVISEYNTLKMIKAKEKTFSLANKAVFFVSLFAFLIMFVFATFFSKSFFNGTDLDATWAIRVMAMCLLVVPFLSVKRGYLQGHAFIGASSTSQVVEQFVRVFVVLVGSYVCINLLNTDLSIGVSVALSGAFFGALVSYFFISQKVKKNKPAFVQVEEGVPDDTVPSSKTILYKLGKICIPLVLIACLASVYDFTDMYLVKTGLNILYNGNPEAFPYDATDQVNIATIIQTLGPKICVVISALAMGLTSSIVPHIVDSFVKKDYAGVNEKHNKAINTIILLALPMAVGMCLLSGPLYSVFYGQNEYGTVLMRLLPYLRIFESISMITALVLQSVGSAWWVVLTSGIGLVINACFDVPMILLCGYIGLPPYWGAGFSSVLGYSVSIIATQILLKKKLHLHYKSIWIMFLKVLVGIAGLIATVLLFKLFIPVDTTENRILQFVYLCIIAFAGGAVFFVIEYFLKGIQQVFGNDFISTVLSRLHLKKSSKS